MIRNILAFALIYATIISNAQMPELNGYDALKLLRALPGSSGATPVIAITAHALSIDRERLISVGMDGYVAKPFTARRLLGEIHRVIAGHQASHAEATAAKPLAVGRFSDALAGFDGDLELFSTIAADVANAYEKYAGEILQLAQNHDYFRLGTEAHKISGTWKQYCAPEYRNLCSMLERHITAMRTNDINETTSRLALALRDVARELRVWVSHHGTGVET